MEGNFFFPLFRFTITFLAVYGFYEKILKRLTHTDKHLEFKSRPDFMVTLKEKLSGNKKIIFPDVSSTLWRTCVYGRCPPAK